MLISMADGQVSNCPRRGIRYVPKRSQNEPTRTTTYDPEPTATGVPFLGKGNMIVSTMGQIRGCIISYGTWYASGSCATFQAKKATGTFFGVYWVGWLDYREADYNMSQMTLSR